MSESMFDRYPLCGCMGCRESAVAAVDHPDHGRRVVCEDHVGDYPVLEEVGA